MKKCVFPGSFNPFTKGHEDVVNRALSLFDEVHILIARNPTKDSRLLGKRADIIQKLYKCDRVKVEVYDGLTVDYCKANDIRFIVRGIRNGADLCYESDLAHAKREIGNVETVFLLASNSHISSSLVRDLINHNADIKSHVPEAVADEIVLLYKDE